MINTIINDCDGLIYSLASKYKNSYNIEDLYQVGCIGVMKAYKNYNSSYKVKFSTYAYNYILGEIVDYIRKDRNIKVSNDYYDIYKRYEKTRDLLRNKYCREPMFSEISSFMNLSENELLSIIESTMYTKSLDYEFEEFNYTKGDTNIIDKITLDQELEKIEEPGRSILKYKYYYGMSQQEIASLMQISQSKVSRQETLALKKMKNKIAC